MKVLNLGSLDVKEGGPTLSTYLGMKGGGAQRMADGYRHGASAARR